MDQENSGVAVVKSAQDYNIQLSTSEIDIITREIGIAHNNALFTLYGNNDIDTIRATPLCHYVHDYLVYNINDLNLTMLPAYVMEANSRYVMNQVYSYIGSKIEDTNSGWFLPNNVDQTMIENSMDDYYRFVSNMFFACDNYSDFEDTCMSRLKQICDSTLNINDYYYMSLCGNVTFESFCAWATIFSNTNNGTKGMPQTLREAYNKVKNGIMNMVNTIGDFVEADAYGASIGSTIGVFATSGVTIGTGQEQDPSPGVILGSVVGAVAGSIHYAKNH